MDAFSAIILGAVEGLTEFLPVSSTGHLILAARLLRLPDSPFLSSFEIAVQLGAILAVVAAFWRRVVGNPELVKKVAAAFVPTALIGLALHGTVKAHLLGNETVVVWALALGGAALIVFEKFRKPASEPRIDLASMSYGQAALIGLAQSVAIIPGVSRSAATIVGGLLLGWSRPAIVEFSFLLAVPTMAAATGLDLLKTGFAFSPGEFGLLALGAATAFLVARAAIKWLMGYVAAHDFTAFGIYRLLAAAAFWWFILRP